MTDMDHAGSYPFCPQCATRVEVSKNYRPLCFCEFCSLWFNPAKVPITEDRHREAMRLACWLGDDE